MAQTDVNLPPFESWPAAELIAGIREESEHVSVPIRLVGGAVRDLLLGRPTMDLDFVTDRDLGPLVDALAQRYRVRPIEHPRFMTAALEIGEIRIDLNRARSECYSSPGALPDVVPASYEEDARRRDFSINTMAIPLATPDRLLDPLGGVSDLEQRDIRALHAGSFLDDPTRIDRAHRFAGRLDFEIETDTRHWIDEAIDREARLLVSPLRLFEELRLHLRESAFLTILDSSIESGALAPLGIDRESRRALPKLASALSPAREIGLDIEALALGVLSPVRRIDQTGKLLQLSRKRIELIREIASTSPDSTPDLSRPEVALIAAIESGRRVEEIVTAIQRYRALELPFRGDEVHQEPGSHISKAIRDTRNAIAWGSLEPGRALAFAQNRAVGYLCRE